MLVQKPTIPLCVASPRGPRAVRCTAMFTQGRPSEVLARETGRWESLVPSLSATPTPQSHAAGGFFTGVQSRQQHLAADPESDSFHGEVIAAAQSSTRLPSLRHRMQDLQQAQRGQFVTAEQCTGSNHIPGLTPVVFVLVCNSVQKTQLFSNTGMCLKSSNESDWEP